MVRAVVAPVPPKARGRGTTSRAALAAEHLVHRAVVERERARTGRTREALLRAGVGHVDVPLVDAQLDAAQRGDGVGDHERVVVVRDVGQFGDVRLEDPGRGLRVNEPEHVRLVFVERALNIDRVEGFAPRRRYLDNLAAAARARPSTSSARRSSRSSGLTSCRPARRGCDGRFHRRRSCS